MTRQEKDFDSYHRLERVDRDIESVFKEMKEISGLINKIQGQINASSSDMKHNVEDIDNLVLDVKSLWDKYRSLEKDILIIDNKLSQNKGKIAFAERLFWISLSGVITIVLNFNII